MILRDGQFEDIVSRLADKECKIVIYGAGMIGKTILPYWLARYHIENKVLYYVDMDESKWGNFVRVGKERKVICGIDTLMNEKEKVILLITNSNFLPVLKTLDDYSKLKNVEAYIVPIILLNNSEKISTGSYLIQECKTVQIPKKIHYCWFSGNPLPETLEKCIDSWKRFCPDYEIIRWDESNYDIDWNLYMRQAYDARKWGFVPDVARLDILYKHGGIYLDTDVELIKGLDDLLYQSGFCGVEKWGNINFGSCSGAVAGHPMIKELLDYRKDEIFLRDDGKYNLETCGYYETTPFIKRGFSVNNETQRVCDMTVYSSEYFCPYDYMSLKMNITPNTYAIHHFNGGWLDEKSSQQRLQTQLQYTKVLERMK